VSGVAEEHIVSCGEALISTSRSTIAIATLPLAAAARPQLRLEVYIPPRCRRDDPRAAPHPGGPGHGKIEALPSPGGDVSPGTV
jgi:hypothetical protein